jgi:nucleotide-binding universal stress UspA family protein
MKILLTTDGSSHSLDSVKSFIEHRAMLAGPQEVALLNVHLPVPYSRAVAWVGKENVQRYYEEECEAALVPATELLDEHGVAYTTVKRIGDPAREIVKYADEWGADLIVAGTHGHSAVTTLVLGSVAQKVLAHTTRPILLLK